MSKRPRSIVAALVLRDCYPSKSRLGCAVARAVRRVTVEGDRRRRAHEVLVEDALDALAGADAPICNGEPAASVEREHRGAARRGALAADGDCTGCTVAAVIERATFRCARGDCRERCHCSVLTALALMPWISWFAAPDDLRVGT